MPFMLEKSRRVARSIPPKPYPWPWPIAPKEGFVMAQAEIRRWAEEEAKSLDLPDREEEASGE
jgi:hypothetical protein